MKNLIFNLLIVGALLLTSSFVFADESSVSSVTATPAILKPSTPLSISFSASASPYVQGTNVLTFDFYLSTDSTLDVGMATHLLPTTTYDSSSSPCTGDITTGATCTYPSVSLTGVADGTYYVFVLPTLDNVAGTSAGTASTIQVDGNAPTLNPLVFTPGLVSGWSNVTQTLTTTCTDTTGCTMQYQIGSGSLASFTGSLPITSANGIVSVIATDGAGNTTTLNTGSTLVQIDQELPAGTISSTPSPGSGNWINSNTPVFHLNANDGGGSLYNNSTFTFKIDGNTQSVSFTGSPVDFTPPSSLSSGSHTATLDGADNAGNAMVQVSFPFNIDVTAPSVATSLQSGTINPNDIALSWTASTDTGGSGIQNYDVYKSTGTDSAQASSAGTTSGNATSITVNGLSSCTTYHFWVKTRDNVGNLSSFSDMLTAQTVGCSNTNGGSGSSGGGSSSGSGSGGGGGSGACNVTFTIPADVYAGDVITAKATSTTTYSEGKFRVTPQGKPTYYIVQSTGTATVWSGPYTIPNNIGLQLAFRFGADECSTATTTRIIKDPATKPSTNSTSSGSTAPAPTSAPNAAPTVDPVSVDVSFTPENVSTVLELAGFNADGAKSIQDLLTQLHATQTLKVVKNALGKYEVHLVLTFTNTANAGTLKVIQSVPKSFGATVDQFTANMQMTTLKDDPLVQFTASDLEAGQTVVIDLVSKTTYASAAVANGVVSTIQGDATNPPLVFASGNAKGSGGELLAGFSGLVGGVSGTLPIVIGFIAVIGLILVSVRVVRSSVAGSDNPILRSSSRAGTRGSERTVNSPIRGKKIWSSGEVRIGDDDD